MATRTESIPTEFSVLVAVVFENGRIRPVWFEADNTRIRIQEICYVWTYREGAVVIINFAVWNGQGTYELHYNTQSLAWHLGVVAFIPM